MTPADLRVVANLEDPAATVAREVALRLDSAVGQRGSASIVLAGGGNARRIAFRVGRGVRTVDNTAGLHGGIV